MARRVRFEERCGSRGAPGPLHARDLVLVAIQDLHVIRLRDRTRGDEVVERESDAALRETLPAA
jgi:hypothetical protein